MKILSKIFNSVLVDKNTNIFFYLDTNDSTVDQIHLHTSSIDTKHMCTYILVDKIKIILSSAFKGIELLSIYMYTTKPPGTVVRRSDGF